MRTKHWFTRVPIYQLHFHLIVCDEVLPALKKYQHIFGERIDEGDPIAACRYNGFRFGLFVSRMEFKHNPHGIIAHETFHLTHRMMEYVQQDFILRSHESHALLHEWMNRWVWSKLNTPKK